MDKYIKVSDTIMESINRVTELEIAKMVVNAQPVADVAPVVHAHWYTYPDDKQFKCSNCKTGIDLPTLYCPNCGAKMDEEVE